MMRRLSLGTAIVAVAALGAVPAVAQSPSAPAPVTIRFGTLNAPFVDPVNKLLVDNFKATHPGSDVQIEYITGDTAASYATQAAAGTLPDVLFTADLYVKPFAQGNITMDMEPLAAADPTFNMSDLYENMLGLSKVDGKGLYMIPSSYDVVTMYYNKTMFEAAGAPLPQADWTWDQFIAACQTIKEKTGNYCISGRDTPKPGGDYQWWADYVPWIDGYGGKLISDDGKTALLSSPEVIAAMEAYTALWTKYDIAQPLDFDPGGECFMVGKCATLLFIPGYMSAMRALDPQPFEWDVQGIPSHPQGRFTGMGTYGFAISADTKNPQAAWDFVKFLDSQPAQKAIADAYAGIPMLKSMAGDPPLPGPPNNIGAFVTNGANGILPTNFPGNCGSLYAGLINQEIKDAMGAVIAKTSSVTDAFTTANDNIQACLDKG